MEENEVLSNILRIKFERLNRKSQESMVGKGTNGTVRLHAWNTRPATGTNLGKFLTFSVPQFLHP